MDFFWVKKSSLPFWDGTHELSCQKQIAENKTNRAIHTKFLSILKTFTNDNMNDEYFHDRV